MKEKVTFNPRGFRDVHWCNLINEPMIVTYPNQKAYCSLCQMEGEIKEFKKSGPEGLSSIEYEEIWAMFHPFIAHIVKPE